MYRPPIHRKILPWVYIFAFVLLGPILLFYTSGYRYNTKKGQIERNGALIVDSTPKGASVFLDGSDTGEKTPITFQNITPGWHMIRVERAGFIPWEKRLEVTAERVTFANGLWLWRKSDPIFTLPGNIARLEPDPLGEHLALLHETPSRTIALWNQTEGILSQNPLPRQSASSQESPRLRWDAKGQTLLIGGTQEDDRASRLWINGGTLKMEELPSARYYWSNGTAVGTHDRSLYRIPSGKGETIIEQLAKQTVSADDNFTLLHTTSGQLLFTYQALLKKRFLLPNGNWHISEIVSPYFFLQDQRHWLALEPTGESAYAGEMTGDYPRISPDQKHPSALFLNGNELSLWNPGRDPVTLWRQGEPLIQAIWHRGGSTIFLASRQTIYAIDLDERSGRNNTVIATFDQIQDMTFFNKELYVVGQKNEKIGLWRIVVE